MIINHNIGALNTHRQLSTNNANQSKSIEKLSSGLRINRAGDDAAGLAISEKMRGQIRGLDQASRNAQDGISLIQTAEGALSETHSMLQRMRELAVQSNNGTNTPDDLAEIQKEIGQLNDEINRVAQKTEFNTKSLLDGSLGVQASGGNLADLTSAGIRVDVSGIATGETLTFALAGNNLTVTGTNSGVSQTIALSDAEDVAAGTTVKFDSIGLSLTFGADVDLTAAGVEIGGKTVETSGDALSFQIGANGNTKLDISIGDMQASSLGSTASNLNVANIAAVNVTTQSFEDNLQVIDEAIKKVSATRSDLGSWQNRLEHTINNLNTSSENLTAAESRIRDVDMAKEIMEQTKNSILAQASQAMLAQANQVPQNVLQLLR